MRQLTLIQLKRGKKARIAGFNGGQGFISKLNSLGIIKGKEIIKISDSFIGGPVTVQVNNNKIAIGSGMASRIIVEVDEP
ncbi:hypothetical protein H0A61_01671 [Koleobacter methoxysyntrophicus]|uniref:Ferrous iron transporter FeoA-like domain-containing protein n=1 Tax=Koleobacter methoxysyntrophicus TaxID=2751313 RepID=A0A8A0RP13_9FIRM|nr:FeoA family protein [Koleobacter methoxysyntrophicus]NPV43807.1 ferrous iron transport protein A [Bacillota bacterium]QSQ09310.1 hypothetical protein H0A61_01671 [Koleobacter methoxysyntrophicus]